MKILILNGPNLGNLGKRQPEIYGNDGMDAALAMIRDMLGKQTYADLEEYIRGFCGDLGIGCEIFQSNHEGELIDRLEKTRENGPGHADGVAFNAGAYTHTSLALADCLAWIGVPCVEVHISNVFARTEDPIRQQSHMAKKCIGVISGFGLASYALAVLALVRHIREQGRNSPSVEL